MINQMKLLFVVEGNTDIRFVDGLSRHFALTLLVPRSQYEQSGLKARIQGLGLNLDVVEISGGRLRYQWGSLRWLLTNAKNFDVIVAQEILRGALNANLAGRFAKVPVVTYVCLPSLEYFDCRRERKQISQGEWIVGRALIYALSWINGKLAQRCFALGDHLQNYAKKFSPRVVPAFYYGVDTKRFRPLEKKNNESKVELRRRLKLSEDGFLVLFSSRLSHEKDPETFLLACEQVRWSGIPLRVLNLSGDYEKFISLSERLLGHCDWVEGRPAVNPMHELADYYRAVDCLVQSSLAEGLGLSPLEALACEVPVVATNVGGMKSHLGDYAQLVARKDFGDMARALRAVYRRPAGQEYGNGRQYVAKIWESEMGFLAFEKALTTLTRSTSG